MCTCLLTIFCTILSLFKHIGIWQSNRAWMCSPYINMSMVLSYECQSMIIQLLLDD